MEEPMRERNVMNEAIECRNIAQDIVQKLYISHEPLEKEIAGDPVGIIAASYPISDHLESITGILVQTCEHLREIREYLDKAMRDLGM